MKKILLLLALLPILAFVSCKNQNAQTEDSNSVPNYPNITAQGVAPFINGTSLLDISPKGDYYDTIIIDKTFDVWDGDAKTDIKNEKELEEYLNNYCYDPEFVYIDANIFGYVIKNTDTLLILKADKDAKIEGMVVMSESFSSEQGIHIGTSTKEMISSLEIGFDNQGVEYPYWTLEYVFPTKPSNIIYIADHTFEGWDEPESWRKRNDYHKTWKGFRDDGSVIMDSVMDWKVMRIYIIDSNKKTHSDFYDVLNPLKRIGGFNVVKAVSVD